MANTGDVQYRMKCSVSGRPFLVDGISSKLPEHPQKGQPEHPEMMYVRCSKLRFRGDSGRNGNEDTGRRSAPAASTWADNTNKILSMRASGVKG